MQPARPLKSVFIGGGTPTVLPVELLTRILQSCEAVHGFAPDAEISIEANPGSLGRVELEQLRGAGVNRLSLGMQSFHDGELADLGRVHSSGQSREVFSEARRAGFENISVDMMYGLAGQTVTAWEQGLEQALGLQPEHISIYQLSVEEGTGLFRQMQSGSLTLPPEDEILEMDEITREICAQSGYEHYEISNFCKPGRRCSHNLVYWRNEEYMGCGAGAVSYVDSARAKRVTDPQAYCDRMARGQSVIDESETLDSLDSFRESVVMGLRLLEGVSEARLVKRFGFTFAEVYTTTLDRLAAQGLLETDAAFLRLTARGRRFANVVMAELV